jgi:peptidyl-prolyl cis-trans isomerase A (cyclophilin A)
MQKLLIATLLFSCAVSCSEEPPPPKPKKAPDSKPVAKTADLPKPPPPPPPPPTQELEKPKPPAPAPKVLLDPTLPEWSQTAPAEFKARFSTTKGDFVIQVTREWAPRGADRFYCLVKNGYYNDVRFFRVITGFMCQFGVNGHPDVNAAWKNNTIQDDPVTQKNTRGTITFAMRGKNTRTTQVFINFDDKNTRLDGDGFAPFGKVVEGMEVVDKLFSGYGEGAPRGRGPDQMRLQAQGNEYLNAEFKDLDYVKSATIVQ